MKPLPRILIALAITVGIALIISGIVSVARSLDPAKNSPVTRLVPTDLKDVSVTSVSGTKLSYFGHGFEVPWDDLDESQTRATPKENPSVVILSFRSGLHLMVSSGRANEITSDLTNKKVSPQVFESVLGPDSVRSDYDLLKNLYAFTPNKMHAWYLSPRAYLREQVILRLKATMLSGLTDTGIFNVQTQGYRGFQLGDPLAHPGNIVVDLYSGEGSIHFIFAVKNPNDRTAVTQPEINCIVQSLHKK